MLISTIANAAVPVCLIVVLVTGFVSACAARLSVGSRRQTVCQWLFLCCLVLVGAVTMFSLGSEPSFWVVSAITFSLMVLTATCDFGRSRQATAW